MRHFGGWICAELVDCSGENGSKEVWLDEIAEMDAFLEMVRCSFPRSIVGRSESKHPTQKPVTELPHPPPFPASCTFTKNRFLDLSSIQINHTPLPYRQKPIPNLVETQESTAQCIIYKHHPSSITHPSIHPKGHGSGRSRIGIRIRRPFSPNLT